MQQNAAPESTETAGEITVGFGICKGQKFREVYNSSANAAYRDTVRTARVMQPGSQLALLKNYILRRDAEEREDQLLCEAVSIVEQQEAESQSARPSPEKVGFISYS